jgi:hypothetical protein
MKAHYEAHSKLLHPMSHWALAICIKKYIKEKEELWKLSQIFHHAKM